MRRWLWLVVALVVLGAAILPTGYADVGTDLERKYGVVQDETLNAQLLAVGDRISQATGRHFRFKILKDKDLNACALPDGRIYFTSGMMKAVGSNDEIAFIAGHEATHILQKHARHQQDKSIIGSILGLILGLALGVEGGEDLETAARVGGGLMYGHYSRTDEYRADKGGIEIMARAGYDLSAAARSMERIQKKYGQGQAGMPVLGWFASHPKTGNRVKRLNELATQLSAQPAAAAEPSEPQLPKLAIVTRASKKANFSGWGYGYPIYHVYQATFNSLTEQKKFDLIPLICTNLRDWYPLSDQAALDIAKHNRADLVLVLAIDHFDISKPKYISVEGKQVKVVTAAIVLGTKLIDIDTKQTTWQSPEGRFRGEATGPIASPKRPEQLPSSAIGQAVAAAVSDITQELLPYSGE